MWHSFGVQSVVNIIAMIIAHKQKNDMVSQWVLLLLIANQKDLKSGGGGDKGG